MMVPDALPSSPLDEAQREYEAQIWTDEEAAASREVVYEGTRHDTVGIVAGGANGLGSRDPLIFKMACSVRVIGQELDGDGALRANYMVAWLFRADRDSGHLQGALRSYGRERGLQAVLYKLADDETLYWFDPRSTGSFKSLRRSVGPYDLRDIGRYVSLLHGGAALPSFATISCHRGRSFFSRVGQIYRAGEFKR